MPYYNIQPKYVLLKRMELEFVVKMCVPFLSIYYSFIIIYLCYVINYLIMLYV